MNNRYFRFIQLGVTILAFYYLFNFFVSDVNLNDLNINFSLDKLLIVLLFFLSNVFHSIGWSKLFSQDENLDSRETFLFGMKSHIGKYSFVKFGNFFIRLSQDYEQIGKKRFLGKAAIEQITLVLFGLTFGLFQITLIDNEIIKIITILVINLFLIYSFNSFVMNEKLIKIDMGTLWYYLGTTFVQFSCLLYFFYSSGQNEYVYYAAIYLFSSAISILVSVIPAGLGVKESIFIFTISGLVNKSNIFNLLIELRILLIIADFLSYLYSIYLIKNKN
tara:strand:- start:194 stop:1021 length:828 start_codon:yes stop_codon:yes gene_type:complete